MMRCLTVGMGIGAHLRTKLEAMSCYKSQPRLAPHARSLEVLEALASFRGAEVDVTAAKAFMLLRANEWWEFD
jgi:N-acetylglucosamine malate deacetylase 1